MYEPKATQRARLHFASRMLQAKDDYDWLEELWDKQPKTNHNHIFGDNRQLIVAEKLYGISQTECNMITQAVLKGELENNEPVKNILLTKLNK